jgi:hypothetical protein
VEAVCPPATPGTAQCLALRRTDIAALPASVVSPQALTGYYGPADIQSAYALPAGSQGSGLTVAIVDAYDLPTAEADLAAYRSYFGLPACTTVNGCFRKVDQNGGSSYPAADANWGFEIALDLDMVSAACPHCNILLVEATTNSYPNLGPAVNTAVSLGAIAVSNSYGSPEWSGETYYDTHYYNHPGVAITVSTGDCGYHCSGGPGNYYDSVAYPAASPYVIAVGGTSLTRDGSARGWNESSWGSTTQAGGAGSGCSAYEPKPSWQQDTGCAKRTEADISAVADPATGVYVFENGNWYGGFGGTSAASPIIAATYALAGRPAAGTYPASYLYGNAAALNDVIGGNNDVIWHTCSITYLCNGVVGYDGPTGLGTPNGIGAFAAPTAPGKPANLVAVAGNTTVGLTWTAPASTGGSSVTGYTVTETEHGLGVVTCSMSGATSCTVSGLANGTEYTFTVHASNSVGPGPESDPSNKVTPHVPTVPGKPTAVTAAAGNASALVSWTAPADNGGSAITGYAVTSSPDGKTCTTSGILSCTVSGLTNGTSYTFTVTATNGVGPGPASDPSAPVTPANLPGKPTAVTATAGNASAVVSWTAPADNGGSAITGYTVKSSPGSKTCTWTSGPLSCTVSALTNGQAYTFTVTATNGAGTGSASDPSSAVTPAMVPGKSSGVTAIAGNASALVSWAAPADNGGSSITGYTVTSNPGSRTCTTTGATGCTVSTLTNGQGYTFTVHATNGVGTGPASDPSAAVTPIAPRTGATYHAITPTRVLDTRNGTGGLAGPFTNHAARTFTVGGVPSGAIAVTGNLTVTGQTSSGYLFIGPVATNNPGSSTLNFPVGDDRANAVTVALGGGGTLSITFVAPSNGPSVHAIFDVTGYFTPDMSGATYHAITPTRVLDTRNGTGGLSGPFTNHAARTFTVSGVPSNATAVTGNLTVTGQTSGGYLYIGPVATNNPSSSTLNFPVGDDRANAMTVALGAGGTLSITFVAPSNGPTAQAIFDVTGYFTPGVTGAVYVPLTPTRVLDTRNGTGGLGGPFTNHAARTFTVGGIPAGATAVTGNLTVTGQTSSGYLFIGPVATNNPTSSTLNFPVGDDRANAVTVALGAGGTLSITFVAPSSGPSAQAIFDVTGYFTP